VLVLIALAAALAAAALFAVAARAVGIDDDRIVAAVAVIGGGLQLGALVAWYLLRADRQPPPEQPREEPR
jgi:opacity protein-like surface antigen